MDKEKMRRSLKSPKGEKNKMKKNDKKITKENVKKDEKTGKKVKTKSKKKVWFRVLKIFIFTMLALAVIGAGIAFGVIYSIINETSSIPLEDLKTLRLTSFVYDDEGNQIGAFYDTESRVALDYEDIPQSLIDAVISIEDERYYEHSGVDIQRTLAAVLSFVASGGDADFGGSTITQQLVKQTTQDKEQEWQRKVREWYRAIELESKLEKDEIITSYLNTVYLGGGKYGVELASDYYFAKSAKELNIAESAALAAMIQLPSKTNPYSSDESKENLITRQKNVLAKMFELEKITQEEYDEALAYELVFEKGNTAISEETQTYFVDAVYEQVLEDLMEQKGIDKGVAQQMLFTGGLHIYTTQDSSIQQIVDEEYDNATLFYEDSDGDFMQSAMVVMDHTTGDVVALIGGADEKEGALSLNRATSDLFKRQPGSTMKPLGAYGPAFEQGVLAPGMGLDDSPLPYGTYNPKNYYGYFNGYVTAREALTKSMNLPALRATMLAGIEYAYNFAKNTGLESLVEADKNMASLALGGVTYGFTVLEMANAYSTIANGGVHIEPKLYSEVKDKDGNVILATETVTNRAMSEQTAYMLTDVLEGVITGGGTASGYVKIGNMPSAGKTGNTNDDYDQWFVGYTPYYTAAVWNGYDVNEKIGWRKGIGSYPYTAIVVYDNVMDRIHEELPVKDFTNPGGFVTAPICRDSGHVATDACRTDPRGDRTHYDIFKSGTVPTQECTVHKTVEICSETKLLANEFCFATEQMSFITRDYVPHTLPRDWTYMLPTETCTVHNADNTGEPETPEDPENPGGTVDPENPGGTTDPENPDGSVDIY